MTVIGWGQGVISTGQPTNCHKTRQINLDNNIKRRKQTTTSLQVAPNSFKTLQIFSNCTKMLEIAQNGSKWHIMAQNGSKGLQMVPNGSKWLSMALNNSKWLVMTLNGPKWLQMAPNSHHEKILSSAEPWRHSSLFPLYRQIDPRSVENVNQLKQIFSRF